MKATPAWIALALLSICLTACGAAHNRTVSTSQTSADDTTAHPTTVATVPTASLGGYLKEDGDRDSDDEAHRGELADDHDDQTVLAAYSNEARPATRRAVTTLVRNYYYAAAAGDGTKACALLYAGFAAALAEDTGKSVQPSDRSCATAVSHIFKELREQFAADEAATMVVTSVHTKGDFGFVVLGFKKAPEGGIPIEREGHSWKIAALVGSDMP